MTRRSTCATLALLLGAVLAQDPAPATPKPKTSAIELLLNAPRRLDAGHVRGKLAELLLRDVATEPTEGQPWLIAEGDGLAGEVGSVRWSATVVVGSMPVGDHSLRHLGTENRDRIRRHTARVVVQAVGTPQATTPDGKEAYCGLGVVAASLLETDVIAIGAAHHGTYDPVESIAQVRGQLTAADPLSAIAPTVPTILLARRLSPLSLDPAATRRALIAEFGAAFGGATRDLIIASRGDGPTRISEARVRIGDSTVMVSAWPAPPPSTSDFDVTPELRCRTAMRNSPNLVYVAIHGLPDDDSESMRRRTVARIVAALCGDDIQVLYWNCCSRPAVAPAEVAAKLRAQNPVAASVGAQPPPYSAEQPKELITRVAATARATWLTAAAHHRSGGEVGARFVYRPATGRAESIWITVQIIEGDTVRGRVDTSASDETATLVGTVVMCALDDLTDWVFERDGKSFGAHLLAALVEQRPK